MFFDRNIIIQECVCAFEQSLYERVLYPHTERSSQALSFKSEDIINTTAVIVALYEAVDVVENYSDCYSLVE